MTLKDEDVLQPGKKKRQLSDRRFWMIAAPLIFILSIGAATAVVHKEKLYTMIDGVVGTSPEPIEDTSTRMIYIATANGEVKVRMNGDKVTDWEGSYYTDALPGDRTPRREVEEEVILAGLTDPRALTNWRICWAELHAEAEFYKKLYYAHLDANITRSPENDKLIAQYYAKSVMYSQAVTVAGNEKIPCTRGTKETWMNYTVFKVYVDGVRREVAVSAYRVLSNVLPLEYHLLTGNTVSQEERRRAEIEARTPRDLQRAIDLGRSEARIAMLKEEPKTRG